jgi:murein DD-endopeptidase MepM/ murein hydrolase activator NlpD
MLSAVELIGSCSPLSAIAVALVALSVAGCSADVTRFDNDPFFGAAQSDQPKGGLSPASLAGPSSGSGAILIPRPKADLGHGGRSAEVVSRRRSAVRVAMRGHQPIALSRRDDKPSAAIANRNSNAVSRRANLRRGNLTVATRGPPAQPAQKAAAKTLSADTRTTDATPMFQWPVHGKILARFGPQPNGEKNYGVTIAVPEDTPIKAAEDGVVIYAGNGLKGFGNLVLVRHTNQYVTAYAHAKELRVRRGDQIKRGDVIAASGQTGNVNTPQLYFEVRKSSAPVDPLPLLHGSSEPDAAKRAASAMSLSRHDAGR